MFRLTLLSLFACAMFMACSSDDSSPLKEWFDSQDIAVSYKMKAFEADISVKSIEAGFDSSAFMVLYFAALGNVNGLEHILYFDLDSIDSTWTLRMDSLFYADFYEGKFPLPNKAFSAELCWMSEDKIELDSIWLKKLSENISWEDCDIIPLNWQARSNKDTLGTFNINYKSSKLYNYSKKDSMNLLLGLRLIDNDVVLRIEPPSLRIAQKSRMLKGCRACLYAGAKDSVKIALDAKDMLDALNDRTVVFAQLAFPADMGNLEREFDKPIPVYAYRNFENAGGSVLENYILGAEYAEEQAYPYMLGNGSDSLILQITETLRHYAVSKNATPNKTLAFSLKLGNSVIGRPDYAKYDFGYIIGQKAKLKFWLADYSDKK